MDYLDEDGVFCQRRVIESLKEMEDKIKEEEKKENVDKDKLTRMYYEQLLRGIHIQTNPLLPY